MKRICVLTSSRAEYGLLRPLINRLCLVADVSLCVTGSHLCKDFGNTVNEIIDDKYNIDVKIPIVMCSDTPAETTKSMGICLMGFADYFGGRKPEMLVVLGDRYETFAVCIAAYNAGIPIAHIHGGETTYGAADEGYRHAITKLSQLHFASCEEYRRRIIQLGEHPDRVFNVGALGVENAMNMELMSKKELSELLKIDLEKPYAVVTYHPETVNSSPVKDIKQLLSAVLQIKGINFIFTKANADTGGRTINGILEEFASAHPEFSLFDSLGPTKYLSLVKYSAFQLGNSSSGIIEAPALNVPVVNVGDRQKGRIKPPLVLDCKADFVDIIQTVQRVLEKDFLTKSAGFSNPYYKLNTSKQIAEKIESALFQSITVYKEFYDSGVYL